MKEGFDVMVYTSDDPIIAQASSRTIGCVADHAARVADRLGHGHPESVEPADSSSSNAKVPVLVDAGVGTASDAAIAMELGCARRADEYGDRRRAANPVLMASAMKKAVEAGREAFRAGRVPPKFYAASPSSPTTGPDRLTVALPADVVPCWRCARSTLLRSAGRRLRHV